MSEMSRADVELVYKYLNDRAKADIEHEAHSAALEQFDRLDALEAANDDMTSSFSWGELSYEFNRRNLDRDELVPLAGVEPTEEPEVYDLAHDFGWLVVEQIRDEIRSIQETTIFSPREFVALVLSAECDEQMAASLMDISVGNYRGKKGSIETKLQQAETTLDYAQLIRGQ